MKYAVALLVVLSVPFAFASFTDAAPGEPRFVQGVLEWPAKLTVEPFIVVRTEDGRWYYAEIKTAKRLESAPLTAGARVAILGTEATRPYEITAIALGLGDASALAIALMPLVQPTAAASAPPPSPTTESPGLSKPVVTEPPQTSKTVAEAATVPAPAAGAPQPPASDAGAPAKPQVAEPPTEKTTFAKAVDQSKPAATPLGSPADSPRMSELRGTVKIIAGNLVVVQAADGHLVLVDLSALSGGAASLKPGSSIAVYGTLEDQKFQATGLVQHETRPPARPITVPPRR